MLKKTTPRLSLSYYIYAVLALILMNAAPAKAQDDCGCDHVISTTRSYIKASDIPTVKPGDVICIQAGVRSRLKFIGFQGTKEQPIIFKNCGGQVIFDMNFDNTTLDGQLLFEKSRYFRVTGTGSPDHKYGFLIRKTRGSALQVTESDFELDHIEIADAGFAGIFAKLEASCTDTQYNRGNFIMDNISIHDNYVHDTHGEGMYIGSSWWHGKTSDCGTIYPPELHNLRVYNNIVENTGADGMQIGCAAKNAEVYNNVIRNYGFDPFSPVHTNGLMINGGYQGKIYNNQIFDGAGMGLNCFGIGNVYMYNNLVVRAGTDGIFIDERGPVLPGTGFHTHNNTVVAPKRDGIRIYSRNSTGNTFVNNLVVAPGSLGTEYYNKDHYLYVIDDNVDYSQKNNLFVATVDNAGFTNATANDYQLKSNSPAIDKGAAMSYITFDLNREARPQGAGYDIGTYEFGGESTPVNAAPVVHAGADKTMTLPESSTTLTATASDADGSIASVNWTKVSGPAATLSGASTLSLNLFGLVEGEYIFRFTAKDNQGATSSDDVTVTVKAAPVANIAPVANAGADQAITLPTNSILLNGTATDKDGSIASTTWTKVSGPAATLSGASTLTLSLSSLVEGTYTFRLTATDNAGASSADDVQVTVNAAPVENTAPVVDAGADKTITLPENSTVLTATATDKEGSLASTTWTKVSGPEATLNGTSTLSLSLSNLLEGTYTFRLTAEDSEGVTSSDDVTVTVNAAPVANVAPVVHAGADKTMTLPESSTTLTATASDADGSIASVNWTKVSGPAATLSGASTLSLNLFGLVEGEYIFRFTAKDNQGATSSDDVTVTVKAAPVANVAPVANAGADQAITLPANSILLNGTATDKDGSIASTTWTKVSGPAATLLDASSLTLSVSNLVEGTYTFRLTVEDNAGASAFDDVVVTVHAESSTPPAVATNGLNYSFYTAVKKNIWNKLPDYSTMTAEKTGIVPTISLNPKTQNDFFGFVFEGFLEITVAGNYTFYTLSDEGSQLFINNILIANNDGSNNAQERSGSINLTAGFHPIKINYFERNGGEKLEVSYKGPGFSRKAIPSAVLYPTAPTTSSDQGLLGDSGEYTRSTSLAAPDDLSVRYNSEKGTAYLSWNDKSTSETGFEVMMAIGSSDSEYKKVGSTGANKKNYTVVHLRKGESYQIRVRARTRLTFSEYSNVVAINDAADQLSTVTKGQRVLVNFNYGPNAAAPWNNFDQDPDPMDMMSNLKDEKGKGTSVSVKLLTPWGWATTGGNGWNNLGTTTGNNSGVYPDDVMKSCFWTERSEAEEIEISGLQPGQLYRFTFFASRDASGDRTTHYTIGKKTVSLNASYNTKKKVNIYNAKAGANGKIKVYVQKGKKAIFGYLNAMVIEATGYVAPGAEETEAVRTLASNNADGVNDLERTEELGKNYQTFSAYPNPATDHIILHYKQITPFSKIHVQVIDLTGNVRMNTEDTASDENGTIRIELDPSKISSGYYLLRIQSESGEKTLKFLKL